MEFCCHCAVHFFYKLDVHMHKDRSTEVCQGVRQTRSSPRDDVLLVGDEETDVA